jgi:tRNA(fMet)-specific endonuclease VapC
LEVSGILIDTNAYVAFTKGVHAAVDVVARARRLVIPAIALRELRAGFAAGKRESENLQRLEKFLSLPRLESLDVDSLTAVFYGKLHAGLRAKGRPLPTNDIWIAASALQHDLWLFSYDLHFQAVDGLRVGTTLSDFANKS